MEDQKCPMQRPVSTAVLCVAVVLKQLRGTPELFSIWCQQHEGGRDHDMGGCLANGTLRRLGLCHSVPARCIQSPPYCRNPAPRQSICGWPPPPRRSWLRQPEPSGSWGIPLTVYLPQPRLARTHKHTHSPVPLPLQLLSWPCFASGEPSWNTLQLHSEHTDWSVTTLMKWE